MKRYCLKDIHWIYTNDGKFVTPFIFNNDRTKIRDLENDEIIEFEGNFVAYIDVIRIFSQDLHINEKDFSVSQFIELVVNKVLELKGVKNLKYLKVKHNLLKNGYSPNISNITVNEEEIKQLTKEIVHHFKPKQTKKESASENLSNQTKAF